MTKKITLATLKKFIRDNENKLLIMELSKFDGQVDSITFCYDPRWEPAYIDKELLERKSTVNNTLGINGVWITKGSKNYYYPYQDAFYTGIKVSNCTGSFILAVERD